MKYMDKKPLIMKTIQEFDEWLYKIELNCSDTKTERLIKTIRLQLHPIMTGDVSRFIFENISANDDDSIKVSKYEKT